MLEVDGGTGSVDDLVAGTERGLLLTCLWYIREVDPQTLLLTGLTRDGVYLVEDGEITGAVNNFRFNESPVDLLRRFTHASATVPSFSREWGDDYFSRTATPALRVPDFNMSSVSPGAVAAVRPACRRTCSSMEATVDDDHGPAGQQVHPLDEPPTQPIPREAPGPVADPPGPRPRPRPAPGAAW